MELLCVFLCLLTFIGKSLAVEIQLFATEESDIILPCSPIGKNDLTYQLFDWKRNDTEGVFFYDKGDQYKAGRFGQYINFKNRVEFFQDQLQFGNASIRIKNTKLTDGGIYSCEFPKLQPPGQKFYIKVVVGCILKDRTKDPERKCGTCPKPAIKILQKENGGVKVQCVARGAYPEPKMELQNSDNVTIDSESTTISQNGNFSDIILQAVVTKEDSYHCVVKQEKICHQIYSEETLVLMPSGNSNMIAGLIGTFILGAVITAVICCLWQRCKKKRGDGAGESHKQGYDKTKDGQVSENSSLNHP